MQIFFQSPKTAGQRSLVYCSCQVATGKHYALNTFIVKIAQCVLIVNN